MGSRKIKSKKQKLKYNFNKIGNSVETSSLSAEEGQFFSIKPLNGKYEAVKAPEGTVFYIPITRPSSFQIIREEMKNFRESSDAKFESLEMRYQADIARLDREHQADISRLDREHQADISRLDREIKSLKIIPSVLQFTETVRQFEQNLFEQYFPLLFFSASFKNRKFEYLESLRAKDLYESKKYKRKEKTEDIKTFLSIPEVERLNKFIKSDQYKNVSDFRNSVAHEALEDVNFIVPLGAKLASYFTEKKIGKVALDSDFGNDLPQMFSSIDKLLLKP